MTHKVEKGLRPSELHNDLPRQDSPATPLEGDRGRASCFFNSFLLLVRFLAFLSLGPVRQADRMDSVNLKTLLVGFGTRRKA